MSAFPARPLPLEEAPPAVPRIRRWRGSDESGAVLVGVHAFGDYGEAFAEIAEALAPHGHEVIAYDQRGFGDTAHRGAYAGHDAYRRDLATIVHHAATHAALDRPIVVIAESFGASVALSAAGRGLIYVDGLIVSGPGVREDLPRKGFWDALIQGAAAFLGSRAVRVEQGSAAMSERARRRFRLDPLVLRDVRADTYEQVVDLADAASIDAGRIGVPTLVLYGEDDGIIARPSIDALMRRLGRHGVLRTYPGLPHLALQSRDRAAVDADILDFLARLRPTGGSG
jgi:alpha-beta hydrolase superfamily lysophospholipase